MANFTVNGEAVFTAKELHKAMQIIEEACPVMNTGSMSITDMVTVISRMNIGRLWDIVGDDKAVWLKKFLSKWRLAQAGMLGERLA